MGDLDFVGVATMAEALSPVPGGVGPITDVWLLENTAARVFTRAEETRRSLEPADAGKNGISRSRYNTCLRPRKGERIIR